MEVSFSDALAFRKAVLDFYSRSGRSFPWRETEDPWAIFVSEIMLQQTQTSRVEPKYLAWMNLFPDAAAVAGASLASLYEAWSGLGYNARALRLREAARICVERHGGLPPRDEKLLLELPGVGPYTARAVMAFAYRLPGAFLETNIRAALIFHFFPGTDKVGDRELLGVAGLVLDASDPRSWYYALMDYGAWLKGKEANPARRAGAYTKQTRFDGSLRQARGAVLKAIGASGNIYIADMAAESGIEYGRLKTAAEGLCRDGLIILDGERVSFAE